jgi:hypothetical protein
VNLLKEFEVTITETLEKKITVEALSKGEAEQAVRDMWNDEDIILDADDFIDVSFNTDDGKELSAVNESKKLDVLLVEPGQYACMTTIDAGLKSLQKTVGGDIEAAYFFDDPVALVCQEEGKINGSELNRAVRDADGEILDIIAGKFFICGLGEEDFTSLPEGLQKKYEDMFHQPETFLKMGRSITAIPIEPKVTPDVKKDRAAIGAER